MAEKDSPVLKQSKLSMLSIKPHQSVRKVKPISTFKIYLISPVMRKMQITTSRYHFAQTKILKHSKCWLKIKKERDKVEFENTPALGLE